MAAVNEWIVREFFELRGFLVSQPQKHKPAVQRKEPAEDADLLAVNPTLSESQFPSRMEWVPDDLRGVARAIVGVRGWHTDRFSSSVIRTAPEMFRFAEPKVIQRLAARLGGPVVRILCLSGLPASATLRKDTLKLLREKGVDGVILFRTLLTDLIERVDIKKNYEKSDLLQIVRLLKNYDLLRDDQLELFDRKRKRRKPSQGSS